MRIVSLIDGKVLKTRTITRLVRENQFNVQEFKNFKVATHESNVSYQEDSNDQMLFKDLVQKFLLQQKNNVKFESAESESQNEVDQELQLLQDLRLQEWCEGDLQGYSEKEVKGAIKKELVSLSSSGHEVYDQVPLKLLSREDQAKVIESRWVIGPQSAVLKARFVGKGFAQVIDKEAKSSSDDTQDHFDDESASQRESSCVRCGISISHYSSR